VKVSNCKQKKECTQEIQGKERKKKQMKKKMNRKMKGKLSSAISHGRTYCLEEIKKLAHCVWNDSGWSA